MEPTTGIEPVNLILTKDVLYLLSYVGIPNSAHALATAHWKKHFQIFPSQASAEDGHAISKRQ